MDQKLQDKLNKRIEEGTLRSLSSFDGFVDFFSNDYLGYSKVGSPHETIRCYGSTGSRLISGTSRQAVETELFLADFYESEACLMYNSGYDANLGFFSSVPQKGDTVIYDEFIHASIRDGLRLSFAKNASFRHNDLIDLEKKLNLITGVGYLVVESLYSMDGDIAPLKEIAVLCSRYNVNLVVDEAHACGVFGENGRGIVSQLKLEKLVFARIITFGKAYGAHGACVLSEQSLKEYLINFSRSFIYTTALPPEAYSRIKYIVSHFDLDNRQESLKKVIHYFREQMNGLQVCVSDRRSPIQLLRIGNIDDTKFISEELQKNNIAVKPIYSPTVPVGNEGLRICLHAFNTEQEIDLLKKILQNQIVN